MRFIRLMWREIESSPGRLGLFVLCTGLAMSAILGLGTFERGVNEILERDAKVLSGGDILIESSRPRSEQIQTEIDALANQQGNRKSEFLSFPTVVYAAQKESSLLTTIKVVDQNYPLYGTVRLESDLPLHNVLQPGTVIVERSILERLQINIGAMLKIGAQGFTIADVWSELPDAEGNFFASGPTLLMSAADVAATELLGARSRISYDARLTLGNPEEVESTLELLKQNAAPRERVESFQTESSPLQRFLEELLLFTNLLSLFTVLLAGIGMLLTLHAFFATRREQIAVLKTLGTNNRSILRIYLGLTLGLTGLGALLGLGGGALLLHFLPQLFDAFLPAGFVPHFSWPALRYGLGTGVLLSLLFTVWPLLRLNAVKPVEVFRKLEAGTSEREQTWLWSGCIVLVFSAIVLQEIGELRLGLSVLGGIFGFFVLLIAAAHLILKGLRMLTPRLAQPTLKLALRGLMRPGSNATLLLSALAGTVTLLLTISLLQQNLVAQFVNAYPEEYPNVIFLDIQSDQRESLSALLPNAATFYPIIRGSLLRHNQTEITEETREELGRANDDVTRSFNLSYGIPLSDNEEIVMSRERGRVLLENYDRPGYAQVSVLQEFGDLLGMQVGDELTFLIQGIELKAEIVSIRHRREKRLEPYFYFLFEPKVLQDFPQTLFTTVNVAPSKVAALQTDVTRAFPNITTIDVSAFIARTAQVLEKLTAIIRVFTGLSLSAGLLLLLSSLISTSLERVREAVYYKLLGVRCGQILRIVLSEFVILGCAAALLAIGFATAAVWWITKWLLSINFIFFPWTLLGFSAGLILLIVIVAALLLSPLLRVRPVQYLRENTVE